MFIFSSLKDTLDLKNKHNEIHIRSLLKDKIIDDIITLILLYQNEESYYVKRIDDHLKIYKYEIVKYQSSSFCEYKETNISCKLIKKYAREDNNIYLQNYDLFQRFISNNQETINYFETETQDEIERFIQILKNNEYIDKSSLLTERKSLFNKSYSENSNIIISVLINGYYNFCYIFKDQEAVQDMIDLLTAIKQYVA